MHSGYLKVNLDAIKNNWKKLNKLSLIDVQTSAVLKANSYGLGIEKVALALKEIGVKTFFVATLKEGIKLRKIINNDGKIYLLNGAKNSDINKINQFFLIPVLYEEGNIIFYNKMNMNFAIQVEIGMNRLGIESSKLSNLKNYINTKNLDLLIGHFSSADDKFANENKTQFENFSNLKKIFSNTKSSLCATAGIINFKQCHYDVTRPGIGLFGGVDFVGRQNVIKLSLPVLQIKNLKKGEFVGYNHTFKANENIKIAILSGGYADGLLRILSNKGSLFFENIACPIIGRVSMDLITVDISNLKFNPTKLDVINETQTIEILAKSAKTISYEILTNLSQRYKRKYNV